MDSIVRGKMLQCECRDERRQTSPEAADPARAAMHLQQAVVHDPDYTAAWKLLGRALADTGDATAALAAYRAGIAVAQRKGDKQAGREMEVFAKRLAKARDAQDGNAGL